MLSRLLSVSSFLASLTGATLAFAQTVDTVAPGNSIGLNPTSGVAGPNRPSQGQSPVIGAGAVDNAATPFGAITPFGTKSGTAPQTDALPPIMLGAFTINPGGTAGAYFDDNVFALQRNRRSDVAFFARPEISAFTQGPGYGMQAAGFIEGRKYTKYGSEDQVNGGASASGVVQPDADTQLRGRVQYLHGHEDRGAGDSVLFVPDRPVAFDLIDAAGAINKRWDRWFASIGVSSVGVFYRNTSIQGVPVDQSYRNVVIPAVTGRVGYVVAPLTSVFAEVTGNLREYRFGPLSSRGYRVVAGLLFEPGPEARIKGEVFAGYINQDYVGPTLRTVSTWTAGGAVSFLLTDYTTFTVEGRREAKESGLLGGTSLIESSVGGRVDHQLFDNLVIGAGATYLIDDFKGVGRADRYISPLASLRYTVSRNVTVGLDYRHVDYKTDAFGGGAFRRNVVLGAINVRF